MAIECPIPCGVTVDGHSGNLYFVSYSGEEGQRVVTLHGFHPAQAKLWLELALTQDDLFSKEATVCAVQHIPDLEAVCVVSAQGDIVLYNIAENEAECVGLVESGVKCMAWSPDNELVAFVTGSNTLLLMTKNWDVIAESSLFSGVSTVGAQDEATPALSWRGDGSFVGCNAAVGDKVMLQVWDRAGVLQATSEDTQGLQPSIIAWRPSGNIIACTQSVPHKQSQDIVFFERNGLRHGEFSLRSNVVVQEMKWNPDSEILGLLVESSNKKNAIQLWHMSNFRWYLKHSIIYPDKVISFLWDTHNPLHMFTFTASHLYEYQFHWEYSISEGTSMDNESVGTVIDGSTILFTPFRFVVVPPPMSSCSLSLENDVISFSYSPEHHLAVLTQDAILFIGHLNGDSVPRRFLHSPTVNASLTSKSFKNIVISRLRQLVWVNKELLLGLYFDVHDGCDVVVQLTLEFESNLVQLRGIVSVKCPARAFRLFRNSESTSAFLELANGQLLRVNWRDGLRLDPLQSLPSLCSQVSCVVINGNDTFVALDDRARLYVRDEVMSNECNSFFLHSDFLLYTTVNNKLCFLPLRDDITSLAIREESQKWTREIERGSSIVCAVPQDIRVILQMPRGNLECISPRIITLESVHSLLSCHEYGKAFTVVRKHRIDMNLLCDHDLDSFLDNADKFVAQIDDVDHLNLFITSLSEDDVLRTMYPRLGQQRVTQERGSKNSKILVVCEKLRSIFEKSNADKFLLCILTTLVKTGEEERALEAVRGLKEKEKPMELVKSRTEEALKYLCWLVNVDNLFDIALGMYDFELVLMVAAKSQKDPKEYLPFLRNLQQMEENYRKYYIDNHLKKYPSALLNLSKAGVDYFDQCLNLMKEHKLYTEAVRIYSEGNDTKLLNTVMKEYGDFLVMEGRYEEAGLVYSNCNDNEKALLAFKSAGDWQMVLATAGKLHWNDVQILEIAHQMAETLKGTARYAEAAQIILEYCNNVDEAVTLFIEANLWQQALRVSMTHHKPELVETLLRPAVADAFDTRMDELLEWHHKFAKQSTRLETVKVNKILFPKLVGQSNEVNAETSSMFSGMSGISESSSVLSSTSTTSTSSGYSGYSSLSNRGKRQRKQRKKKQRITGKEGSLHEEEYLIDSLKQMIPTESFQERIGSLIKMLIIFGERDRASKLQHAFKQFLALVKASLSLLILSSDPATGNQSNPSELPQLRICQWEVNPF